MKIHMKVKVWMLLGLLSILIVISPTINLVSAIGVTENITSGTEYGGHYGIVMIMARERCS